MRFHGEYQHSVDAKGRVSMPARFRKALPDDLTIVPVLNEDMGKALYVFSEEAYEKWMDRFFDEGFDPLSKRHNSLSKYLNALAETVSLDSAGRVKLSDRQCAKVGIGKDVTFVGQGDHVEIWDTAAWNEFIGDIDPFSSLLRD